MNMSVVAITSHYLSVLRSVVVAVVSGPQSDGITLTARAIDPPPAGRSGEPRRSLPAGSSPLPRPECASAPPPPSPHYAVRAHARLCRVLSRHCSATHTAERADGVGCRRVELCLCVCVSACV